MKKFSFLEKKKFRLISLSGMVALLIGVFACEISAPKLQNKQAVSQPTASLVVPSPPSLSNTTSRGTITVSTMSSKRSISPNLMCFNANTLNIRSWKNKDFLDAVNRLHPSTLRIPGGAVANYWNWEGGGIIQDTTRLPGGLPPFIRAKRRYAGGKLVDFKTGLDASRTTPIFVLNMLTSNLDAQMEMLEAAERLGIPVQYIELGNEFYFDIPNYTRFFPTPEDYAKAAEQWAVVLKKRFPKARIAMVGVVPNLEGQDSVPKVRQENWNKSLLRKALSKADAITLHLYWNHGLENRKITSEKYPLFTADDVSFILGEPFRNLKNLQASRNFRSIPNNTKIWITEYNLFEKIFVFNKGQQKKQRVVGSWAHGMYNMAMSLALLEENKVDMICNHVLVGNSVFGSIFPNKNAFVNPSDASVSVIPFDFSATGYAMQLLGEATKGMDSAQKVNFSDNLSLIGNDDFNYDAVYGWMFSNGTSSQAIVMNLSNQSLKVNLSSLMSRNATYSQLSADPRTLVTNSKTLQRKSRSVSDLTTLPAYSVTKLSNVSQ